MERFEKQLSDLKDKGRYRSLALVGGVDLTSNDYLGFADHPVLRDKAIALLNGGMPVGAAASRLLRGYMDAHGSLETYAAEFFQAPAALYFSSGFQANMALLTCLPSRHDVVIYDGLVHASTRDGIAAGAAKSVRVAHNDVQGFEDALRAAAAGRRTGGMIWIVVEAVYSMDGDLAPLAGLYALAETYDAMMIVDEAHSVGVIGAGGRGCAYAYGYDRVVTMHTCGKALGVAGGLVCASAAVIDYLVNKARGFIYSTAPMPLQAALVEEALRLCGSAEGDVRRTRLAEACALAAELFGGAGTHIVPVILGGDKRAVMVADALQQAGYDVRAIRPPTVPEGSARLRLSLSSETRAEDLQDVADILKPFLLS